jgi:flagellar biosynthesis/type III secretory pathway protein FliH
LVEVIGEAFVELDGVRVPIRVDPSLKGIGCVARNETSQVDGRVHERLRAVRQSFEDAVSNDTDGQVE